MKARIRGRSVYSGAQKGQSSVQARSFHFRSPSHPTCTDLSGYQQSTNVASIALTSHIDLQSPLASSSPIAQICLPDNGGAAN